MLDKIPLENILFIDIETVSQYPNYDELPDKFKKFWDKKAFYLSKNDAAPNTPNEIYQKAGIYSEFGKIVTIALGYIRQNSEKKVLYVKAISDKNERIILAKFNDFLDRYFNTENHYLCAHNGREFDFPFIARRSLINNIKIAKILNTQGAKPWEIKHIDTLDLWKFGDYKHWVSLDLLTAIFDIPSPKDDIDGSMVNEIYWKENDLERIAKYCKKDVVALTQLYLKFNNSPLIEEENILFR